MHQKVLLIDDSLTFLGTANMTYESMKMHDNFLMGFYHRDLNTFFKEYTQKIMPLKWYYERNMSKAILKEIKNNLME